jgi:MtN3 and saliva related transmembrane protein
MATETLIGIAASIFTGFSLVPQLVKLIRSKKANDISYGMMLVLFAGLGLWIAYGVLKNDMIIIISNSFSFFINLLLMYFSIRYKSR